MEFRLDFLLCTERCGSNLLTRILDSHPQVCGPPPSHLIRTFAGNILRYGGLQHGPGWDDLATDLAALLSNQLGRWQTGWTAPGIVERVPERSLAAAIRCVYREEARAEGKQRAFVKENRAWTFLPYILASFPDARFVYLVRDPRDMALSWKLSPNHPGQVNRGAAIWQRDQRESIASYGQLAESGRIQLLRYEDLLADPEEQLSRLCKFLDLGWTPEMLDFHTRPSTVENSRRLRDWANLEKPLLTANSSKYRSGLSELEIRTVEAVCRKEMEFLGYAPDFDRGDPESLRTALAEVESGAPEPAPALSEYESAIRERRLAVVHQIQRRGIVRERDR